MFKFIKKLFGCKSANTPVIDRMIETFGHLIINNDATYSGGLYGKDANGDDLPAEVKCEKYFKIKIGELMSGRGDWGGGFDFTCKPFVEIHVDCYSKILHVCAGEPFYNSSANTKKASIIAKTLVDELNAQLKNSKDKRAVANNLRQPERPKDEYVVTNNRWLRGVLDTIRSMYWMNVENLWERRIEIRERSYQR